AMRKATARGKVRDVRTNRMPDVNTISALVRMGLKKLAREDPLKVRISAVAVTLLITLEGFVAVQAAGNAGSSSPYVLEKTIPLGAGERWDYVTYDPVDKRAYAAHGDHVTVVDVVKGRVVGDVGPFPGGTHGIAISHASGHGYTDDGKAGT